MEAYGKRVCSLFKKVNVGNHVYHFCIFPNENVSIKKLAMSGWYYEVEADAVRWPSCGVKIFDWQSRDRPKREHRRAKPSCRYVMEHLYTTE